MIKRCDWVKEGIHETYHDKEWGVPIHNDRKLFEFLVLDSAQAGLSWAIILKRREGYRDAFDNFEPRIISKYTQKKIKELLKNSDIIRNEQKIKSVINNSKRFLEVKNEFGTFDKYIWKFVKNKTIIHKHESWKDIPATSKESHEMSKDMKKRGFTYVGPTICYAFMQTIGMINDHVVDCFRKKQIDQQVRALAVEKRV
jgi:DNA-3-methyladenine glycosylase I